MTKPPEIAPAKQEGQGAVEIPKQLRGDTISFAIQHIVQNVAANFYEPAVDTYFQKKYFERHKNGEHGFGNYSQNLAGQFIGDLAGGGALIAAELLIPNQLHAVTRAARRAVDPIYDHMARRVLADEHMAPDYEQKVRQWKDYQERSLVRTAIMVSAGMAANIMAQKAIGNPSPKRVILGTKIISTALTNVLGLASRFAFPEGRAKLDNWVSDKVVQPLLSDMPVAHTDKLLKNREKNNLTPAL